MAYVLVAMAVAFGFASCVGTFLILRKINTIIAKAASDPDHIRRTAALPLGYRVLSVVSSITLVTSVLAFGNSGGLPWLAPFKGVTVIVAFVSAACCLLVYWRVRRN